ncbi:complex 1 protein-domain-containing protein [Dipodascopsis tothii]|uniref:complex 1 protein-domain-containing protein n=1 Tax=Dipodascopsis tothii TaxID=44089 RepID=UPI0034CD590F
MSTGEVARSLYRSLLRASAQFSSYNFRMYALRRTKDAFREHRTETDPKTLQQLLTKAENELVMLRRQTQISQMYTFDKLVVEAQSPTKLLKADTGKLGSP